MMRLLNVELARLRWRRAIVVLLLACVVLPFLLLAGYAWSTRPVGAAEIAAAKEMAAEQAAQPYLAEDIERCEASPEDYLGPGGRSRGVRGGHDADVRELPLPTVL